MTSGWLWQPGKQVSHLQSPSRPEFQFIQSHPQPWRKPPAGLVLPSCLCTLGTPATLSADAAFHLPADPLSILFWSTPFPLCQPTIPKKSLPQGPSAGRIRKDSSRWITLYFLSSFIISLLSPSALYHLAVGGPSSHLNSIHQRLQLLEQTQAPSSPFFPVSPDNYLLYCNCNLIEGILTPFPPHFQLQPSSRCEQDPLSSYLKPFLPFSSPQLLSSATH